MGNCLKTQLKESVQNDYLLKEGEMMMRIVAGSGFSTFYMHNVESCRIEVIGSGYFASSTSSISDPTSAIESQKKTSEDFNANTAYYLYFKNTTTYSVKISGKYSIKRIQNTDEKIAINIDDLKYSTLITHLYATGIETSGNIESIANLTRLQEIKLTNSNIKGNISSLGKCTNLSLLWLTNKGALEGSVEDFVSAQILNSRDTEDNLKVNTFLTVLTFGGSTHSVNNHNAILTWESANKIIVYVGTSISSSTQVFERGATASEIAAWQAAGKTVTDVVSGTVYPPTNA